MGWFWGSSHVSQILPMEMEDQTGGVDVRMDLGASGVSGSPCVSQWLSVQVGGQIWGHPSVLVLPPLPPRLPVKVEGHSWRL